MATLFRTGQKIKVSKQMTDTKGQLLWLDAKIYNVTMILLNIYAPNTENEQLQFYTFLADLIKHENL